MKQYEEILEAYLKNEEVYYNTIDCERGFEKLSKELESSLS